MLNEAVNSAKEYVTKNKKSIIILILLLSGIFMLIFSSSAATESPKSEESEGLDEYKKRLEGELADICSSVSGVGKCRVTVTFERGEEKIYKGSSLIESRPPKVMGVTVVCKGADSDAVKAEIVGMMSALFDIGANRIAILKLNS